MQFAQKSIAKIKKYDRIKMGIESPFDFFPPDETPQKTAFLLLPEKRGGNIQWN